MLKKRMRIAAGIMAAMMALNANVFANTNAVGESKPQEHAEITEKSESTEKSQSTENSESIDNTASTEIEEAFSYIHDPRENDKAMEDILENPDAVYGFSPDPESARLGEFASYDWTDPEVVAKAKQDREEYHKSLETMLDILHKMRDEGSTVEEMARAVSEERNRLRLAAYEGDSEGLEKVKKSNLEKYGNENGPTPESLFEKYGSWEIVLQKSFSTNMGMDACCGLYDDQYSLYQELGLAD